MNSILGQCPVCSELLEVTRLHCRSCDTTIEGHFDTGHFSHLSADQIAFIEVFLKKEGKINGVGRELGLSYPTVRSRLHDVIAALGLTVEAEEEPGMSEEERQQVLNELAQGKISTDEALNRLETS
jgi:hypothetical protein